MDSEVFARIRDYLADQLEVEPEKITPDSDIVNDFGAVTSGCAMLLYPSFGFTPSQKSTFSRLTTQKCTFLL